MVQNEILVAVDAATGSAVGNIWRIKAKKTDFYIEPHAQDDFLHLSVHGPNANFPDRHRFHVKVNRKTAATAHEHGSFAAHGIPRKGYEFGGLEVARNSFLVTRVRWTWDMQRKRYRAAAYTGSIPDVAEGQFGAVMRKPLGDNEAVDLDIIVSFGDPHWIGGAKSAVDNARLGPLRNDAGMSLTGTFVRRWQSGTPHPPELVFHRPEVGDEPNRILGGAPDSSGQFYWFVEGITSRRVVEASQAAWLASLQ